MSTPLLKLRTYILAALATVVLSSLASVASAQPPAPDLQIQNFSVYSTLPEAGGFRRASISFVVVNTGNKPASASNTRVTIDNSGASFATPPLAIGARAFISRNLRTSASQLAITTLVDASNNLNEQNEGNNELKQVANLGVETNRWISIGPSRIDDPGEIFGPTFGVGRVTAIAVDPRSPLTVYVGARGSGIWKRAGSLWFPIGDSLPSLQIDAIGIYPRTPDRIVVATPMGVFESLDAGEVWTQTTAQNLGGIGSDGGALLIENADNPALYLSTATGLMVSTDNGHNWQTVLPLNSRVVSLQFSTSDPTHLLASTRNPPRVFEGKDRGLRTGSWKQLTGCVSAPLSTFFTPGAQVWITESGRQRWISIRDTETKKLRLLRTTNRVCPINGFTEHAWEEVTLRGSTCANFQNQFSYLFAHPTDSKILFKGGIGLCRSEDRGDTTRTVAKIHLDHHAIVVSPSEPNVMFFGTDGGIYRSSDKGKTMEFFSEGLNNSEFLKIDTDGKPPRLVVAGSQDNGTSTFSGVSPIWNYVGGGDSSIVEFDQADQNGIFEIGQSTRQVQIIQPGGSSQKLGNQSLADCPTYAESPATVFESMASTGENNPRLLITCKGIWLGPPFVQIKPDPPTGPLGNFKKLKLHRSGQLVAATDAGNIFFGRLKPLSFESFQTTGSPSAISFLSQTVFYVAMNTGTRGSIHRLECTPKCVDERVGLALPFPIAAEITALTVDPLDANAILAAVRNRGVFRGTRNGPSDWTWTSYNNGLPVAVTVTDLQPQANGGIIAATFGRGAFRIISRIKETPPANQVARGHITSYEVERVDPNRPPGPNNPVLETIELDSKPGFLFTSSSPNARFGVVARRAIQTKRIVSIEFTPVSPSSGKIISVR